MLPFLSLRSVAVWIQGCGSSGVEQEEYKYRYGTQQLPDVMVVHAFVFHFECGAQIGWSSLNNAQRNRAAAVDDDFKFCVIRRSGSRNCPVRFLGGTFFGWEVWPDSRAFIRQLIDN